MSRTTTIPKAVKAAVFTVAALAIALCAQGLATEGIAGWQWAAVLVIVTIAAGRFHGRLSFYNTVSPDDLPLAASVLILEPRFAVLVAICAGVLAKARFGAVSRALNVLVMAYPVGAACILFNAVTGGLGIHDPATNPFAWFILAFSALMLMSLLHYSLHTAWSHAAHRKEFFRTVAVPLLMSDTMGAALVASLVEMGYMVPGEAKLLPAIVAALGFFGVWVFIRSSQKQIEAMEHRDELHRAIFVSLARLLEMRDPETALHSARVALFSRDIALEMGLSVEDQSRIHLAGLLHDVGKVGVPDEVLLKPGRLTDEERRAMERHARFSAEALAGIPGFGDLARMVYAHHERLDGSGYPEGVAGDQLPLGARILGVADTFEAITADRPYRQARPQATAIQILTEEDHLFDQEVVSALRTLLETGNNGRHRYGELAEFAQEWSSAGLQLAVNHDEEPFVVPPEAEEGSVATPAPAPDPAPAPALEAPTSIPIVSQSATPVAM